MQEKQGVKNDNELSVDALKELVELYKGVYTSHKQQFPTDPLQQLRSSVCAVFESWEGERAVAYRKVNKITGLAGTAVNVQVCWPLASYFNLVQPMLVDPGVFWGGAVGLHGAILFAIALATTVALAISVSSSADDSRCMEDYILIPCSQVC
jgi:hypothetical protein